MPNMIDKKYNYAVVGASQNKEKFGYKVFKNLVMRGFELVPVNPKGGELLGFKVEEKLENVSRVIDVVIFVVPPVVSNEVLKSVEKLSINKVWFQPGTYDLNGIDFCEEHNIEFVKDACIMTNNS